MARIFRITLELHQRPFGDEDYCFESYEKVRMGTDNRILHFGVMKHPEPKDLEWIKEVVGAQIESLMYRTTGITQPLEF